MGDAFPIAMLIEFPSQLTLASLYTLAPPETQMPHAFRAELHTNRRKVQREWPESQMRVQWSSQIPVLRRNVADRLASDGEDVS